MSRTQQVAALIAFAIVLLSLRYIAGGLIGSGKEPVSVSLEREAEQLNATLPEMVSQNVRLDKTAAGPGNAFGYFYTVVDDDVAKKFADDPTERDKLRAQLRERVCTNMPAFRENGVVVNYSVRNSAGATITDISINPKDC
jgi:hypothetical protein